MRTHYAQFFHYLIMLMPDALRVSQSIGAPIMLVHREVTFPLNAYSAWATPQCYPGSIALTWLFGNAFSSNEKICPYAWWSWWWFCVCVCFFFFWWWSWCWSPIWKLSFVLRPLGSNGFLRAYPSPKLRSFCHNYSGLMFDSFPHYERSDTFVPSI